MPLIATDCHWLLPTQTKAELRRANAALIRKLALDEAAFALFGPGMAWDLAMAECDRLQAEREEAERQRLLALTIKFQAKWRSYIMRRKWAKEIALLAAAKRERLRIAAEKAAREKREREMLCAAIVLDVISVTVDAIEAERLRVEAERRAAEEWCLAFLADRVEAAVELAELAAAERRRLAAEKAEKARIEQLERDRTERRTERAQFASSRRAEQQHLMDEAAASGAPEPAWFAGEPIGVWQTDDDRKLDEGARLEARRSEAEAKAFAMAAAA